MRVSVDGLKLHYVDVGLRSGRTIVLIHGFPFSSEMWEKQIQALKNSYRVVAFDLRRQGKSDVGDGQFTLLVDDLMTILDKLKVDRAVLCGLSMGGYVALRAIEHSPNRVSGLVLCDTKSEADTNQGKLSRGASIKLIKRDGVRAFATRFLKDAFSAASLSDRTLVDAATRIISKNKPLGLCGTLLALACRTDTTLFLSKVHVPTLIVVGEFDKITPPEFSERMHASISKSQLRLITNAGHLSNMENPEEFNLHLLSFLDQNPVG